MRSRADRYLTWPTQRSDRSCVALRWLMKKALAQVPGHYTRYRHSFAARICEVFYQRMISIRSMLAITRFKKISLGAVEILLFISCCLFAPARSGVGAAEGKINSRSTGWLSYFRRPTRVLQATHYANISVVSVRETVPVDTPTLTNFHCVRYIYIYINVCIYIYTIYIYYIYIYISSIYISYIYIYAVYIYIYRGGGRVRNRTSILLSWAPLRLHE